MTLENSNQNIPSCSVSQVTGLLGLIYNGALKVGIPIKQVPSVFLWGPPGIGKSASVKALAAYLEKSCQKQVVVTDVRLYQFSPVDLRGVPVADKNREFTVWLQPELFKMDASEDVINILFLDELSAAPQSVQTAAYQITQDRRVGEHKLPDNCVVIAAGNRTTDQSVSYKMPKALANRMMHIEVRPDFPSWKTWAVREGIDSRIVQYLSSFESHLYVSPKRDEQAFPTPRSWANAGMILKSVEAIKADGAPLDDSYVHQMLSACIGKDEAVAFALWCNLNKLANEIDFQPKVEDIRNGRCCERPKTQDALYLLSDSLVELCKDASISSEELENICCYAAVFFPADYAQRFFDDIRSDEIMVKLMKCASYPRWRKYLRGGR